MSINTHARNVRKKKTHNAETFYEKKSKTREQQIVKFKDSKFEKIYMTSVLRMIIISSIFLATSYETRLFFWTSDDKKPAEGYNKQFLCWLHHSWIRSISWKKYEKTIENILLTVWDFMHTRHTFRVNWEQNSPGKWDNAKNIFIKKWF